MIRHADFTLGTLSKSTSRSTCRLILRLTRNGSVETVDELLPISECLSLLVDKDSDVRMAMTYVLCDTRSSPSSEHRHIL